MLRQTLFDQLQGLATECGRGGPSQVRGLNCERDCNVAVMAKTRVLIADDNVDSAQLLSDSLTRRGCLCEIVTSSDRALNSVRNLSCDLVICDIRICLLYTSPSPR